MVEPRVSANLATHKRQFVLPHSVQLNCCVFATHSEININSKSFETVTEILALGAFPVESARISQKRRKVQDEVAQVGSSVRTIHARSALGARALGCARGERHLFQDLEFELENGGLLQVRGRNGSGKTSLLRMVCGLLPPASGEVIWNNTSVRDAGDEFKANLAYVGHLNGAKDDLNALENLHFSARVADLICDDTAVREALREFGLGGFEHLPCKFLSQGQRRRLALSRLKLSVARPLWVLDEPFAALDAAGITAMGALLEDHLARGGLALLTTHQDVPISAPGMRSIQLGH